MAMAVLLVLCFVFPNCYIWSAKMITENTQNNVKDLLQHRVFQLYFPWTHLFIPHGRRKGPLSTVCQHISTPVYFPHISISCLLLRLLLYFSVQPNAFLTSNWMPSLCCLIIKSYIQTSSFNVCISQLLL